MNNSIIKRYVKRLIDYLLKYIKDSLIGILLSDYIEYQRQVMLD